jgi:hypothetical protein
MSQLDSWQVTSYAARFLKFCFPQGLISLFYQRNERNVLNKKQICISLTLFFFLTSVQRSTQEHKT